MAIGFNSDGLTDLYPTSGTPPIGTYRVNSWGLQGSYISIYFGLYGGSYKDKHYVTVGASPSSVYNYSNKGGCFCYRYA